MCFFQRSHTACTSWFFASQKVVKGSPWCLSPDDPPSLFSVVVFLLLAGGLYSRKDKSVNLMPESSGMWSLTHAVGMKVPLLASCFPSCVFWSSDAKPATCGSARLWRVVVGEQQLGEAARRGEGAPVSGRSVPRQHPSGLHVRWQKRPTAVE